MMLPSALILGAHFLIPVVDSVPVLNVDQVCTGIAQQGGVTFHDSAVGDEKKNCIDSEMAIRDELSTKWGSFVAADKTACTNESRMGGESSYTELLTCLEMARDVRTMRSDEQNASAATPAGGAKAPPGHAQPHP